MIKKILSILCIGVICLSIVNPVQVSAYSELDTEIQGNLTEEQMEDAIGSSIISYLLATGAELIVPGSGQTVASIYEEINDVLDEALDIKENLIGWFQDLQIRYENPSLLLPWNWDKSMMLQGTPLSNAAEYFLNNRRPQTTPVYPDVNYQQYIDALNPQTMWWFNNNTMGNLTSPTYKDHSYFSCWVSSGNIYLNNPVAFTNNSGSVIYKEIPLNLYINEIDGVYYFDCPNYLFDITNNWSNNNSNYYKTLYRYNNYNMAGPSVSNLTAQNVNGTLTTYNKSGTLQEVLEHLVKYFRNVNLFVNGQPWSIVDEADPVEIGGNTYLTGTNLPVEFKFPEGTLNDLALIKSILYNLIDLNNTGNAISIKIDDILNAFTDEYGNPAMYVVVVHRNDYDVLIQEQYPYRTVPGENNLALSRDSILESYNTQAKYLVKDMGTDVIPSDILRIIGAAGALLLVAYLINRMLE